MRKCKGTTKKWRRKLRRWRLKPRTTRQKCANSASPLARETRGWKRRLVIWFRTCHWPLYLPQAVNIIYFTISSSLLSSLSNTSFGFSGRHYSLLKHLSWGATEGNPATGRALGRDVVTAGWTSLESGWAPAGHHPRAISQRGSSVFPIACYRVGWGKEKEGLKPIVLWALFATPKKLFSAVFVYKN